MNDDQCNVEGNIANDDDDEEDGDIDESNERKVRVDSEAKCDNSVKDSSTKKSAGATRDHHHRHQPANNIMSEVSSFQPVDVTDL